MPSDKVSVATIAAALASILVWALQTYAHTELPDVVQGAVVVLLTLGCSYLWPENHPSPSGIAAALRSPTAPRPPPAG